VFLLSWGGGQRAWGSEEFPVPPPPLSEDYFPCAENCHRDLETDPAKRVLEEEHEDVKLHHAEQFRWCLDCHDSKDRDKLRLQSGEKIEFVDSYRLCGQCHGDKYRDWRRGIHGKRTGLWNGTKQYLLCAHCHNPHSPRFVLRADPEIPGTEGAKPMPPPAVPLAKRFGSHGPADHGDTGSHGDTEAEGESGDH
jgi:hypothetical protein